MSAKVTSGEVLNFAFLTKIAVFTAAAVNNIDEKELCVVGNDYSDLSFFAEARRAGLFCQITSVVNNPKATTQWRRSFPDLTPPFFHSASDFLSELEEYGVTWVGSQHPGAWTFSLSNHISAAEGALNLLAGQAGALVGQGTLCLLDFIAVDGKMNRARETAEQANFRRLMGDPAELATAIYERLLPTLRSISSVMAITDSLPEVGLRFLMPAPSRPSWVSIH
jgi:hypothetical protein